MMEKKKKNKNVKWLRRQQWRKEVIRSRPRIWFFIPPVTISAADCFYGPKNICIEKKVWWEKSRVAYARGEERKERNVQRKQKKSFFMLLLPLQSEKETERKLIFRRSINPAKKLFLLQQALKCFFVIDIKKRVHTRRNNLFWNWDSNSG